MKNPENYKWADLPAATALPDDTKVRVTDVGIGGSTWTNKGGEWRPVGRACRSRVFVGRRSNRLTIPDFCYTRAIEARIRRSKHPVGGMPASKAKRQKPATFERAF